MCSRNVVQSGIEMKSCTYSYSNGSFSPIFSYTSSKLSNSRSARSVSYTLHGVSLMRLYNHIIAGFIYTFKRNRVGPQTHAISFTTCCGSSLSLIITFSKCSILVRNDSIRFMFIMIFLPSRADWISLMASSTSS